MAQQFSCGPAKDGPCFLSVAQPRHYSDHARIDFILPVLRSDRVLCALAEFLDLQTSADQLSARDLFADAMDPLKLMHDQRFTDALNHSVGLHVNLANCCERLG